MLMTAGCIGKRGAGMTREEAIEELSILLNKYQDGHFGDAIDMAMTALEQEPCEDAVSRGVFEQVMWERDVAIEQLKELGYGFGEKPRTGHWILLDDCSNSGYYCSECLKKVVKEGWSDTVKKIKFCPNCGARMVEPQESEG